MEQHLYTAVSSTSSWLDGVENNVFSGSVLLAENTETQLQKQEVRQGFLNYCNTFCNTVKESPQSYLLSAEPGERYETCDGGGEAQPGPAGWFLRDES